MADNTTIAAGSGGDVIATDDLTSLNGAAVTGVKAQRSKMGWGVDGTFLDVSAVNPLPITSGAAPVTYAASINGLAPAALATDIFTIAGSATKVVSVSKLTINGVQATAGQAAIVIVKRSAADTLGTSTAQAAVPYDSTSPVATAAVLAYTANPTLGALIGNVHADRVFLPGTASASDAQGLAIGFGDVGQQRLVLRGVAQQLAVNLAGVTITGGALNITVEWTES